MNLIPIILCGGSGTRLWPLSRQSLPKQFVPLLNGKSLLQLTFERAAMLLPQGQAVWTVASEAHRFLVRDAAEAAGVPAWHLLEPVGRNTAAAMAVAALNAEPSQILLFLPADHHIPDHALFAKTVLSGLAAARDGAIVTLGITPLYPHTGYGYIQAGATAAGGQDAVRTVQGFIEKPDVERATLYLASGNYYWNAGIFMMQSQVLCNALAAHAPDILAAARNAVATQQNDADFVRLDAQAFSACRAESFDYAVMEHHDNAVVMPFAGDWSDVGSWNAVADLAQSDAHENRVTGQGRAFNARNTYIHAPHRLVVALGTQDLVIIDTTDALLIADKQHTEQVKEVVSQLQNELLPEATEHRHAARPWGQYDTVDQGERFKVKRITVKPGATLSLQLHRHRAEHWVVVKGTARVTRGAEVFTLSENESTFIPAGEKHRLENLGSTALEIIEVQSGNYLGEDDIERFDDVYGRKN